MDDQSFDEQTALDWIRAVETNTRARDQDAVLQRWLEDTRPESVLEIGCGQGVSSSRVLSRYTGIDPSSFLINRAQELYSSATKNFSTGNAYSVPLEDQSASAVFSILVWHLLSDLDSAARELCRVLKDGGNFLIITANPKGYDLWRALYPAPTVVGKRLEELSESLNRHDLVIEAQEDFRKSEDSDQYYFIALSGKKVKPSDHD